MALALADDRPETILRAYAATHAVVTSPKQTTLQARTMTASELRSARVRMGMTQKALGRALGLSPVWISLMETGKRDIEPRTALAVRYLAWSA